MFVQVLTQKCESDFAVLHCFHVDNLPMHNPGATFQRPAGAELI
jgi:hypothetical protein